MTRDELVALVRQSRDYDWEYEGEIPFPLAARDVPLLLLCDIDHAPRQVTQAMADALAALLAVDEARWPEIEVLLQADAKRACETIDYGFQMQAGEDITQSNYREFGLQPDGTAPAGWADRRWIRRVLVEEVDGAAEASISFDVAWEEEHGFHLRLDQGRFEDFHP